MKKPKRVHFSYKTIVSVCGNESYSGGFICCSVDFQEVTCAACRRLLYHYQKPVPPQPRNKPRLSN